MLKLTRILLRFSIYLKRKPTLKKTDTRTPLMQSELRNLQTEQISVVVLWILSLGDTGVPTQAWSLFYLQNCMWRIFALSLNIFECKYVVFNVSD